LGSVATIPAGQPFAEVLATDLLYQHGPDGDGMLADALILLPTRRAVRSLTQAFLRASNGQALLLPAIQPLGDLDDDEPAMLSPDRSAEVEILPAIPSLSRQMLLSQLVLKADAAPDAASAFGLAQSLADLIDETATERLTFAALAGLAPEQFQQHWQETIHFLRIATRFWPEVLAEREEIDPARRRDLLTGRLARFWRSTGPVTPVWIAGSTGSVPGTADLMSAVRDLPAGRIILPGLDLNMDQRDREFAITEPVHPQHGMLNLLDRLGVAPDQVDQIGGLSTSAPRQALLSEALRPAATTERWSDLSHIQPDAIDGLSVIEARNPREEAAAIAVRLREVLETPGRTAALVTPDRDLARRVAAEMSRFGVRLDDSAGTPLRLTRTGSFLQLAAAALGGGLAPADLLALLKHPLSAGGLDPARFRREVRRLERTQLRGLRRYGTLGELADRGETDSRRPMELQWLRTMHAVSTRFAEAADDFSQMLTAHVELCEWLASSDQESGAARLWRGGDGEAAANAITGLLDAAVDAPDMTANSWAASFDRLAGGSTVRPRFGQHPRLFILGPLEARLQKFDLTILGGLNENIWPAAAGRDPWMSRQMRESFGLPSPERRTGLQAHDFMQLAADGDVVLTRSLKSGGAPTVPSRWLLRLQSVIDGASRLRPDEDRFSLPSDPDAAAWANALDVAEQPIMIGAPAPCPPPEARPKQLPVTAIERLIRDPYAIYAARILKLKALDPIDDQPGPMLKGNIMHAAFERLAKTHHDEWTPQLWPELQRIGAEVMAEEGLPPSWRTLWTKRFEIAAQWLLQAEADRPDAIRDRLVEVTGELHGPPGLPDFVLTAKADRLDLLGSGAVTIADYKTGKPPSKGQIEAGFAVQLPLTGWILKSGGFADVDASGIAELLHIQVHGAREGGDWIPVKTDDLDALIEDTAADVTNLLIQYAEAETPYRCRPHVQFARGYSSDFDHLARHAEWSVAGGDSGEGGSE
jgi:ATP-dependent helicase/nuclease subunit B